MRSCKETIRIISAQEKLGLLARMELKLHLLMCLHCRNYAKQIKALNKAVGTLFQQALAKSEASIKALEEKILQVL